MGRTLQIELNSCGSLLQSKLGPKNKGVDTVALPDKIVPASIVERAKRYPHESNSADLQHNHPGKWGAKGKAGY